MPYGQEGRMSDFSSWWGGRYSSLCLNPLRLGSPCAYHSLSPVHPLSRAFHSVFAGVAGEQTLIWFGAGKAYVWQGEQGTSVLTWKYRNELGGTGDPSDRYLRSSHPVRTLFREEGFSSELLRHPVLTCHGADVSSNAGEVSLHMPATLPFFLFPEGHEFFL